MKRGKAVIGNENGMHLRVAAEVVSTAVKFGVDITVCKDCVKADGCSILSLLMLGAEKGTEVEVTVSGENECAALDAVLGLFTDGAGI